MNSFRLASLLFATAALALGQSLHPIANIFDPKATPADSIYNVSILMLAICAAIFVVVGGLLAFTIVRFRSGKVDLIPGVTCGSIPARKESIWATARSIAAPSTRTC